MKTIEIINGIPYLTAQYDTSVTVTTLIPANTPITLPNSASFFGAELLILLNGQAQGYLEDYYYSGSGPTYTAIAFYNDIQVNDIIRFRK